ncbi:MAG TPA: BadF/BadG/BcrA/BcrD ATPase family protein [Steroidobacteraceae bacterium]|nr:BadF/BadG/BcrA/BcrD ATPase family protein [Steroidobacteraceae bacterium]
MKTYLGVDGGGSKTRFLLIDEDGKVLGTHTEGSAYHLEIGLETLEAMLAHGIGSTLQHACMAPAGLTFAFFGLPAYGEDRSLQARLDAAPAAALPAGRYRCGNDMVCGWAGALAGAEGINIVAGTGSIAYGEYGGRSARAGGWGELFSDEGSAHWLAREGLRLFSRMSDGRSPRAALHALVRRHFALEEDLDLCAAIYGKSVSQRSQLAQLSRLVAQAASAGDAAAIALFRHAASELVDIVDAVRDRLQVPPELELPLSYSGGLFQLQDLLLAPFEAVLTARSRKYRLVASRLPPDAGAALHAAKLAGEPLAARSIAALEAQFRVAAA